MYTVDIIIGIAFIIKAVAFSSDEITKLLFLIFGFIFITYGILLKVLLMGIENKLRKGYN